MTPVFPPMPFLVTFPCWRPPSSTPPGTPPRASRAGPCPGCGAHPGLHARPAALGHMSGVERHRAVSSAERGGQNLSESRSRSVAIIIFAITTITYIRTDLRGPRGERGTSAEAARLSAWRAALGGISVCAPHSSTCGHRKLAFLVRTPNPRTVTEPYLDFPLATAASSSRFALMRSSLHHESMNSRLTKGCFSSKAQFSAVTHFRALVRKSPLPLVYTGFVQRGLPRSSPKNAAAPLY